MAMLFWAVAAVAADGVPTLRIEGRIAPAAGVVLPAAVSWIVELRDDASEQVLVEQRKTLSAQGWPAPFSLKVEAARLQPGRAYSVRAAALVQDRVAWLSPAQPVRAGSGAVDVGVLVLATHRFPGAFSSRLRCGEHTITLGFIGNRLRLGTDHEVFDLDRQGAPPSQRFENPGDAGTHVVIGDQHATVSVRGQRFERCVTQDSVPPAAGPAHR